MNAPRGLLLATALMALGCFLGQALVSLAFVAAFAVVLVRYRRWPLPGLEAPLLLYAISFVLSATFGHDPAVSWLYASELKRPFIAVVVALAVTELRPAAGILACIAAGAAVTTAVAFAQWIQGGTFSVHHVAQTWAPYELIRPHGLASTCNDLGMLLAQSTCALAAPALFFALPLRTRALAGLAALISGLGLLRSLSRAALLAALAGLAATGLLRHPRRCAVLALALCAVYPALPASWTFRHREIFSTQVYSNRFRVHMVPVSLEIARRHFPWGAGRRNFPNVHASLAAPGEEISPHAHNNYLQLLAENGPLGLIALIWLQAATLAHVRRALRCAPTPEAAAIHGGVHAALVAFAVAGLFHFTWGDAMPVSLMWVLTGLSYGLR